MRFRTGGWLWALAQRLQMGATGLFIRHQKRSQFNTAVVANADNVWSGGRGVFTLPTTIIHSAIRIDASRRTMSGVHLSARDHGQVIDDAGGVFRRVMDAATAPGDASRTGATVHFGIDWESQTTGRYRRSRILAGVMVAWTDLTNYDYQSAASRLDAHLCGVKSKPSLQERKQYGRGVDLNSCSVPDFGPTVPDDETPPKHLRLMR